MDSRAERGPFYCEVCDCDQKDSASFRDHLNGKLHNKRKGIDFNLFKDSTFEEVKEMLKQKKKERDEKLANAGQSIASSSTIPGGRNFYEEFADDEEEKEE